MKTTTIIAPIHTPDPAIPAPRGTTVLGFVQGTLLLAGIVVVAAALLLMGLVSWPIRFMRRRFQSNGKGP
ncbi:hypothetical protein OF122_11205 [Pelagibacterium flavum]|uniref:Uncharacterized protein n=1 Tax=Pelagibacterium flavum TaxID=2984530 RepID=A0ABY6IMF8_9HYPH|nr:hypothetical protein [Pelagibacterium sp. YIM 151497]UYQ70644.1 hypothetical protein OF122_11205 [Pelagibacterium sp. YIM 151497]|tara:strand:- start:2022 stop:2231 length:210 start_codon:yes stop_codon:yes gene_type:complete